MLQINVDALSIAILFGFLHDKGVEVRFFKVGIFDKLRVEFRFWFDETLTMKLFVNVCY